MAKDFTLRATIKGDDQLSPAARSAAQGTEQLVKSLEKLGVEGEAARDIVEEFTKGLNEGAKEAINAGGAFGKIGDGLGSAQGRFQNFISFLKSRFVITLGDVVNLVRSAMREIEEAVSLKGAERALAQGLAAQGQSLDAFLAKLDEVAQGTVSRADLIATAGRAILLGIPAKQIADLLDVARASAIATGESVSKAFEDIATGVGRASPQILDNLGIIVDAEAAYAKYGESIGKSSEELTTFERKQAILNEVLDAGKDRVEAYGNAADATATQLQRANAGVKDFQASVTNLTIGGIELGVSGLARMFAELLRLNSAFGRWLQDLAESGRTLPVVGGQLGALADRLGESVKASDDLRRSALGVASDFRVASKALIEHGDAAGATAKQSQALLDSLHAAGPALVNYETNVDRARKALFGFKGDAESATAGARSFDAAVSDLGVSLEQDLVNAIEVNNLRIAEAEKRYLAYASGVSKVVFTINDYNAVVADATAKNAELARRLAEHTGELSTSETAWDKAGKAAGNYAETLRTKVGPALDEIGLKAQKVAAQASGVFDRSGNQLPAGGTLSLGGTRYDLPGGGSRLVGAANGVRNPASNIGVNYQTGGGSASSPFSGRFLLDTPQYGTIEAFKVASYGFGPSGAGVSTYGVLPGGRIVLLREQ